jgi:hypothetical protein
LVIPDLIAPGAEALDPFNVVPDVGAALPLAPSVPPLAAPTVVVAVAEFVAASALGTVRFSGP